MQSIDQVPARVHQDMQDNGRQRSGARNLGCICIEVAARRASGHQTCWLAMAGNTVRLTRGMACNVAEEARACEDGHDFVNHK